MSDASFNIQLGILRIVVKSAHDLPGGPDLSCSIDVGHGENGGSTHVLARCGSNPIFNAALSFPYEEGEPVEFEVKDSVNGDKVICDGLIHTDIAMKDGGWNGEVKLDPQGYLKVSMDFFAAPKNPPPKATITITKGVNFTNQSIQESAVSLFLDGDDVRQTKVVSRNSDDVFVWNQPFEFDYDCEQFLTVRVQSESGAAIAEANYELWAFQNQGIKAATGQLPVADSSNQTIGQIGIQIVLYDPKDLISKPEQPIIAAEPESRSLPAPPQRSLSNSSSPSNVVVSPDEAEAARRATEDAEAAREFAKAAAVGASLRPSREPRESARQAADFADDAERAAADAVSSAAVGDSGAQDCARKASEARRKAEDAAKRTLLAAADDALASSKEASRRATQAADAANEIAERFSSPEAQEAAAKARAAANKAAVHLKKCEGLAEEVKNAIYPEFNLETVEASLKSADKEAKATQRQQLIAEECARLAKKLAKKQQKDGRKQERLRQEQLKQRERELEALNESERKFDAQREAERRKKEQEFAIHERFVHKTARIHSYHGDNVEPTIRYENGIAAPAVCCYIPTARSSKANEYSSPMNHPAYIESASSSTTMRNSNGEASSSRYRYDLDAYGVPDPDLDDAMILIEGEMQSPTCCMCCGLRWKKCDGH